MADPLFSIVTVTLNCLEDAILTAQSVLGQTFAGYEYIIKDGKSTDGTIEGLQHLGQKVVSCEDYGIYNAMNQAISYCRGQFIYFLNAGDVFFNKDVLFYLSEYACSNTDTDIDFYYGNVVMNTRHPYASSQENRRLCRRIEYPSRLTKFFLYRSGLCHQAWLVRKEVYLNDPFDIRLPIMADYDFLLKQILRRKIKTKHISRFIVNYRGFGRSEEIGDQWLNDRRQILNWYFSPIERLAYEKIRLSAKLVLKLAYRMRLFELREGNRED